MNKQFIIAIFLATLALSLPISDAVSVSVGETFRFNIKKAYGSFKFTNGAITTQGNTSLFRVGNTGVAKGQDLDVEITSVASTSVNFKISNNGTQLATATSSSLGFALGLIGYSLYPFIAMGISEASNVDAIIDVNKGVSLGNTWFVAPPSIDWSALVDLYNNTENTAWQDLFAGWANDEGNLTVSSSAYYYDEGETLRLTLGAAGNYIVSAESTNLIIIHQLRFDYNVTNNLLQGYNLLTIISGEYKGEDTIFSMSAQIAEENYTRRMGMNTLILVVTAISVIGVITIIRKRK
ncbi:MAG: hypothetical protein JXA54_07675 [Candidatus Heimdallarchaeota archaeon]|nr:hypothetical protein [Candidatus Heimdallarchaeota archaeon]